MKNMVSVIRNYLRDNLMKETVNDVKEAINRADHGPDHLKSIAIHLIELQIDILNGNLKNPHYEDIYSILYLLRASLYNKLQKGRAALDDLEKVNVNDYILKKANKYGIQFEQELSDLRAKLVT